MNASVRLLLRVLYPRVGCPHGVTGMTSARGLSFTTAMRMVDRVHCDAAIMPDEFPTSDSCRPCRSKCSRDPYYRPVRSSPCSRPTPCGFRRKAASAARSRLLSPPAAQNRRPSGPSARPCRDASSTLWTVVPGRNIAQRQRIAHQNVGLRATHNRLPDLQADQAEECNASRHPRSSDQRDPRRTVGIVFDGGDRAGIPDLSRLKSISRILRLLPPPWWRIVISPELRRPPVRCLVRAAAYAGGPSSGRR